MPPLGSSSSLLSPQLPPLLVSVSLSSLFLFAGLINVLKSVCSPQFPGTLAGRKKKSQPLTFYPMRSFPFQFSFYLLSPWFYCEQKSCQPRLSGVGDYCEHAPSCTLDTGFLELQSKAELASELKVSHVSLPLAVLPQCLGFLILGLLPST